MSLSVEHLSITAPERQIIEDVSIEIAPGEILAILGETGSGKSLIASAIMGLVPNGLTCAGRIKAQGEVAEVGDIRRLRAWWSTRTFLLPQEPLAALTPLLSVKEQVAEQSRAPGPARRDVAASALERMQLTAPHHRKRPFELSGGMAQRALAAIAAITRAPVLIADEPTKGLDADRRAGVAALFATLRAEGRAILLITHDIALARAVADRVAFLNEGRFVEQGPAGVVLCAPRSAYGRLYVGSDPATWTPRANSDDEHGPAAIEARELAIGHGRDVLAERITLRCRRRQITALLGPSGVGKTTLGRTLLGVAKPLAGEVVHHGCGSRRGKAAYAQKLHQDPTRVFSPWQAIGRSLDDLRRLPGGETAADELPRLLNRFGLRPSLLERRPSQVSGGEAQRLALARILVLKPKFLVADEPTSRLDPPVQAEVLRHLRAVADDDGLSILLITHDEAVARAIADRQLVLRPMSGRPAQLELLTRDQAPLVAA